jgi:hypothetical protein
MKLEDTSSRQNRRQISGRWTGWSASGRCRGTTWRERRPSSGWREATSSSSATTSKGRTGRKKVLGIEVIGHERPFGAEPSEDIKSRAYSNTGDTLVYVYELDGDTLTIRGGEKGSPAYYRGTFSADGDTLTGRWQWPGGGYEATSTRAQ